MALIVEDGTVVAGATAYEDAATTAARLVLLGLSSFDGKIISEQESTIRRVTSEVDADLRAFADGSPVIGDRSKQPRLWPRHNSHDRTMLEFRFDEIPELLKAGIALRCEDRTAGRVSDGRTDIKSESSARGSITYSGSGSNKIANESPEAWQHFVLLRWVA